MIGERKNIYQNANYGNLVMRAFDIDGNEINAFYDNGDNLVFVLDNTISPQKPNVLLVINPDGDKKWDEILSGEYDIDLETIRPKVDNKYQKLDIEYSGLPVYENLINAYNSGTDLEEPLNQLTILRDSAARHSAMMRLNLANETISKTNVTIVKTKETIIRLETRLKTLRSNLSAEKKSIGKVNTKQSASKILKLESQIEATNEKLKRAKKRLESAQKRLEAATVDAELASNLLNQPTPEIKQKAKKNKTVMVAPKYPVQTVDAETDDFVDDEEDVDEDDVVESDVKPLFSEDPQILNDNIAFKPIEFNAPVFSDEITVKEEAPVPVVEPEQPVADAPLDVQPVLESFTPIEVPDFIPEPVTEEKNEIVEERPVLETIKPVQEDVEINTAVPIEEPVIEKEEPVVEVSERPVPPILPAINSVAPSTTKVETKVSRPGFLYYFLLVVLIALSIFTLWLYQKNMSRETVPVLRAEVSETKVLKPAKKVVETPKVVNESVFLTDEPVDEKTNQDQESDADIEPVSVSGLEVAAEATTSINSGNKDVAPVVIGAVPGRLNSSGLDGTEEENQIMSEEDILASKPVFEPGSRHDEMFINEQNFQEQVSEPDVQDTQVVHEASKGPVYEQEYSDDYLYDEEEEAYQREIRGGNY